MEICTIFAERLYSFKYDAAFKSVYDRKLYDWQDFDHIYEKALENDIDILLIDQFFDEIFYDREFFRQEIERCTNENTLFDIFKSLENYSSKIVCFEQSKAKVIIEKKRLSKLRLYSLRVNNTCFIITGGAIKFSRRMEDHPDTLHELNRLSTCRQFLIDEDFDEHNIIDNLFESE